MPEAKPFKGKRETYEFEGVKVELVQVQADMRARTEFFDHSKVTSEKAVRSQWEIYVDGVLRGYAVYPLGVANPWDAYTLVPHADMEHIRSPKTYDACRPLSEVQPDSETIPGSYDGWNGRFKAGKPVGLDGTTYVRSENRFWDGRAQIAEAFAGFVKAGTAPDAAGVHALIKKAKRKMVERQAQDARDTVEREARWAREKAEREAVEQQALQDRRDVLEGLTTLRDNAAATSQMTNHQIVALEAAIKKFS